MVQRNITYVEVLRIRVSERVQDGRALQGMTNVAGTDLTTRAQIEWSKCVEVCG
jgi:hypothetical protein